MIGYIACLCAEAPQTSQGPKSALPAIHKQTADRKGDGLR